jgi:ankyrin repeat protein
MIRRRGLLGLVLSMAMVAATMADGFAQDQGARLVAAAAAGRLAEVQSLIAAGAPLEARDGQGNSALLIAVDRNHPEIVRALIAAGASVNAQAANADTPWLLAGARGRTAMLEAMLPAGPDLSIRNRFGGNALIPACERGHVETIRLLLERTKIDVNHVNNLGWTCLLEIVILGDGGPRHQEATRLVLAAGADPNLADGKGVTSLAHARAKGQQAIARMIEQAGGR